MGYVLESKTEAERLDYQSTLSKYDFRKELHQLKPQPGDKILDAGCGSGIVTKHFASKYPETQFEGCDFSEQRLQYAQKAMTNFKNVHFFQTDLKKIQIKSHYYDTIYNRYVMEHIPKKDQQQVVDEFYRCLKSSGKLFLVDFDDPLLNIYPLTPVMEKVIQALINAESMDFRAARKMPLLMKNAGFNNVDWEVQTICIKDEALQDELTLIPEKLELIKPFISEITDELIAHRFAKDYVEVLKTSGMSLFYNKIIATGVK